MINRRFSLYRMNRRVYRLNHRSKIKAMIFLGVLVENSNKDVQLEMLQEELNDERFNEFADKFDDEKR